MNAALECSVTAIYHPYATPDTAWDTRIPACAAAVCRAAVRVDNPPPLAYDKQRMTITPE